MIAITEKALFEIVQRCIDDAQRKMRELDDTLYRDHDKECWTESIKLIRRYTGLSFNDARTLYDAWYHASDRELHEAIHDLAHRQEIAALEARA